MKATKIPRPTLYRRIQKLVKNGYLTQVGKRKFKRGALELDVPVYNVTGELAGLRKKVERTKQIWQDLKKLYEFSVKEFGYEGNNRKEEH